MIKNNIIDSLMRYLSVNYLPAVNIANTLNLPYFNLTIFVMKLLPFTIGDCVEKKLILSNVGKEFINCVREENIKAQIIARGICPL